MNFAGSVVVDSPRVTVWQLVEDPEAVSRCIPGLSQFEVIDADHFAAQITQTVGPVTAVFAMKLTVTERQVGQAIAFDAVGKTSRGAVSHLRTSGSVSLSEDEDAGHTCVTLSADAVVSGVLGTVAEKVLQKQSRKVTEQFGEALRAELGEPSGEAGPANAAVGPERPCGRAGECCGRAGRALTAPAGRHRAPSQALQSVALGVRVDVRHSTALVFISGVVVGFILRSVGVEGRDVCPEDERSKETPVSSLLSSSDLVALFRTEFGPPVQ